MKEIVVAIIASGVLTKLIDVVIDLCKTRKDVSREALKCLLRNEILRYHTSHKQDRRFGSEEEYRNIEAMYNAYVKLGGNSFIVRLWAEMGAWSIG